MELIKVKDDQTMSIKIAPILAAVVNNGTKPVLGLATGSTPK